MSDSTETTDVTPEDSILEPPKTFGGIARQLGPGLIIAASIVGSGELIATTKTGAQAGISLLWLIIVGCLIKVFVQIELGRNAIGRGQTTLTALNTVPGPRMVVNWILWFWLIMMLVGFGQLGGIVGGVGQSLALARPLTGDYVEATQLPAEKELKFYLAWKQDIDEKQGKVFLSQPASEQTRVQAALRIIEERLVRLDKSQPGKRAEILPLVEALIDAERAAVAKAPDGDEVDVGAILKADPEVKAAKKAASSVLKNQTWDDKYWAIAVTLSTIILLVVGRYGMLQTVSTVLVVGFTFVTIGNVIALQYNAEFALSAGEIMNGLMFSLPSGGIAPPDLPGWTMKQPIGTALATFGIIGVGATELVAYPYWCLEKGYGKYVGPKTEDAAWSARANGWIRVMKFDAFASMIIYTIATIAFFFMGVAVMYSSGLDPEGMRMVSTLLEQYRPVFGAWAEWVFLIGAIAVLYSTYLVANATFTRVYTDAFKVFGLMSRDNPKAHDKSISILSVVLPLISLSIYCMGANPVKLVLLGGTMQAIMLPMLGFAAIYFRYRKTDTELRPTKFWDVMLIISSMGLLLAGGWGVYDKLF
jgi:Mn2+/Fe2+ NRAMP family transporter